MLQAVGKARDRPDDAENLALTTGSIEIIVDELNVLNAAETPAFPLDNYTEVGEEKIKKPYLTSGVRQCNKILKQDRNHVTLETILRKIIFSILKLQY